MKLYEILSESKKQEPAKPRNFVAKNARATTSGAGAHKDKKKAAKQGYEKHKGKQGVAESGIGKTHISPSGVKTNMPPTDDDYEINYGKEGLVAKDRKARGVDVATGAKKVAENIQSVDDWKAAVLQAYPQYADKIKFKGRGLQINAEIPGLDRSFGVYDLGSESGEVLHETATAGSTSAGNVAVGAVYKNKPGKTPKNKDGTAKNALDLNANLLTGGSIKR